MIADDCWMLRCIVRRRKQFTREKVLNRALGERKRVMIKISDFVVAMTNITN